MSKNRVEELEAAVAELQSTVQGLTEELVESKERIRVLEAELDTESPTRVPERRGEETAPEAADADPDEVEEATATVEDGTEGEPEDSGADDIIVA
ncbi:DUF7518 family protein [Natrononativus amylolyticus]|uniref:DUF7518 family protein n=1 Tax=Natrononativus amylolyticus TaxID=2963434 RepID=UPI0020CFBD71|nr:hypothetical protein [Natrononativus amylolyticus]